MERAPIDSRELLGEAIVAGRHGSPMSEGLARRVADPAMDVALDELAFDSLAWMEFCIAVELLSGLELTPGDVAKMTMLSDIERWIGQQS